MFIEHDGVIGSSAPRSRPPEMHGIVRMRRFDGIQDKPFDELPRFFRSVASGSSGDWRIVPGRSGTRNDRHRLVRHGKQPDPRKHREDLGVPILLIQG